MVHAYTPLAAVLWVLAAVVASASTAATALTANRLFPRQANAVWQQATARCEPVR